MVDQAAIDKFYEEVGARVRAARGAASVTQAALSTKTNLTRSSVANLEAGRQRVPLHVLALIAAMLERPIADLVPDIDSSPDIETDTHSDLERLSDTALRFVRDGMSGLSSPQRDAQ